MPEILITLLTIAVVVGAIPGVCNYLILLERKLSAWMQDRIGPNRVGPMGLFQPIADGIKLLLKEEVIPPHVDKVRYNPGHLYHHEREKHPAHHQHDEAEQHHEAEQHSEEHHHQREKH